MATRPDLLNSRSTPAPIAICTGRNRDLNRLLNRRSWAQFDWELQIKHQRRAHNWFLSKTQFYIIIILYLSASRAREHRSIFPSEQQDLLGSNSRA